MLTLMTAGCALPQPTPERPASQVIDRALTRDTRLGRLLAQRFPDAVSRDSVLALSEPLEAFAARARLARAADRTLDVQYYLWRDDTTGTLMLRELLDAAERGVRVRLLLDDHGAEGLDRIMLDLARHPSISVRLFNPFAVRSPRWVNYLGDFRRLNHRMHNKAFIADNRVAIVGGRNIGDEYFGAPDEPQFADLDLATVGPVVDEVSADFDRFWASASAYAPRSVLPPREQADGSTLEEALARIRNGESARDYLARLADAGPRADLFADPARWEQAAVEYLGDPPSKVAGVAPEGTLIAAQLRRSIGTPRRTLDIVSPYFIPSPAGVARLRALAADGVRVRVLTNSLAATDISAVHAGYAPLRRTLLEAGIALYELRPTPGSPGIGEGPGAHDERRRGGVTRSAASLHTKIFAVDGRRVYVGSFNLDPRSTWLNTENGVVVDSPALARGIDEAFDAFIPRRHWRVVLADDGALEWVEQGEAAKRVWRTEPGTDWCTRLWIDFLSLLPIEGLL
ncbi:MAG: phospholipase D family protein [Lautropia sp.]